MVFKREIESNPDKIKAILDMEPSKTIKDVQKLTGRVSALGQFISKFGDKCLSFFKSLKKLKDFIWPEESQEAFEGLKKYMAQAPFLAKLALNEVLVTTGATPFMLAYGEEAVVPVEISHSSPRIQAYNAEENEEGQRYKEM
ncbi:uncharacterized protein LOC141685343 [Apium graveolens]|uniref:uncharacterized protein LOC141685343 n=1 Tax=Apium graveolens TaxID=4045 RepID=UPI003D7B4EF1